MDTDAITAAKALLEGQTKEIFDKIDINGNNLVSTAEVDKFISESVADYPALKVRDSSRVRQSKWACGMNQRPVCAAADRRGHGQGQVPAAHSRVGEDHGVHWRWQAVHGGSQGWLHPCMRVQAVSTASPRALARVRRRPVRGLTRSLAPVHSYIHYIYLYNELFAVFEDVADGDKRVSKDEFVATIPQYLDHDAEKLGKAFDAMDANGGGFVLFDEFARYIIAHMEA